MKKSLRRPPGIEVFVVLLSLVYVAACDKDPESTGADMDTSGDGSPLCDPVGENAEVGGLLNAPLGDHVQVVHKVPQHPGAPGPKGLP